MPATAISTSARCLVRGSLGIDEFFIVDDIVRPGQTIYSHACDRRPGGKGANQAVAIAKAGGAVSLNGNIGPDGKWMLEHLEGAGVDVSSVNVVEQEQTGRALIQLTTAGENSIVLFKGTNHTMTEPLPPSFFQTKSPKITHLVLQNEIPLANSLSYLNMAHQAGIATVFNPSPMPDARDLVVFPWAHVSWLIMNTDEISSLLSCLGEHFQDAPPIPNIPSASDPGVFASYTAVARLHSHPTFSRSTGIICTLGSSGVIAWGSEIGNPVYVPALHLPNGPKDTTGAGDCFTGYFVAGLMRLHDNGKIVDEALLEEVLHQSAAAAGICCEHRGAMESIPSLSQVTERRLPI